MHRLVYNSLGTIKQLHQAMMEAIWEIVGENIFILGMLLAFSSIDYFRTLSLHDIIPCAFGLVNFASLIF